MYTLLLVILLGIDVKEKKRGSLPSAHFSGIHIVLVVARKNVLSCTKVLQHLAIQFNGLFYAGFLAFFVF